MAQEIAEVGFFAAPGRVRRHISEVETVHEGLHKQPGAAHHNGAPAARFLAEVVEQIAATAKPSKESQ